MNRRHVLAALALTAAAPLAPAGAQEATDAALPAVTDFSLGDPAAKVKITEYASFTCPHCATFHADVFKSLKADYIDTGKVQFTYREVYFDRFGLWAALLARCGGEMRYFGISDVLFQTQAEWLAGGDPAAVIENLKRIGRTAGMEDAAMDACLNDTAMAEALVANFQKNAAADGVEATPTLLINGEKHSNMAYADLKAIIDPLLAE